MPHRDRYLPSRARRPLLTGADWQNRRVSTDYQYDYPPQPARLGFGGTLARWLRRVIAGVVLVGLLLVGGTAVRVWQVARIDDHTPSDAIVVLGAAQYDGVPSSVFEARLEQAHALYVSGVAPLVVTVGGKQVGDNYTEAASGRNYLMDQGIPGENIVAVEEGSDTLRSIEAVSATLASRGLNTITLVSDPWHSLRTRTMARDAGLDAWTSPTRQGPAVFTRESQIHGIARETAALLWYQLTHYSADFQYTASQ